jgi:cell division protease FtsH
MKMALGGRAAEELQFGRISTGALSDLERITKMAYSMVSIYGMNKRIGNVSFYDPQRSEFAGRPYSDHTAQAIDEEVRKLIEELYNATKALLIQKKDHLESIAQELLKKEVIFQDDLERILGKRPFENKDHQLADGTEATPVTIEQSLEEKKEELPSPQPETEQNPSTDAGTLTKA